MSTGIKIGDRSQIGERSFIGAHTTIGKDVIMGPEIVIWSVSHRFDRVDIPINQQDGIEPKPVTIGDDVWIGQRVMITPCVQIENHTVIGAGSIVTRDLPDRAVAAGILARIIRMRKLIIN
ncbi:MAG TPA: acyltransferase [Smithellaceae bacterium]|mgnify:CR=1 FL=1|nr:acyltransferase [Smithellaceae bacterium]